MFNLVGVAPVQNDGRSLAVSSLELILGGGLLLFGAGASPAGPPRLDALLPTGHSDQVTSVSLSGDGKLLATASEDLTAILWETATGKKLHTFQGHLWPVTSVSLSG